MRLPFKGLFIASQAFGVNPQNYAQFLVLYPDGQRHPMKGHNGWDFACPTRTEIIAPHSGTIIEAASDPKGYGYYVKIENEEEGSVIGHLDTIDVRVGYQLNEGDHIGWSDNTGNSTAPHCHWGYYRFPRDRSNGLAGFIDQIPYLEAVGIHVIVGQLPVIDSSHLQAPVVGQSGENTYKGLDTTNIDSVKAAIDAWYDVAHGKYKSAEEYQTLEQQFSVVKEQLENILKADENISVDMKNYNEMQVLGYNTMDAVNKALKVKDDIIFNLRQDQISLEKKNKNLADTIAEDSKNNYTAMEEANKTDTKLKEIEDGFVEVAKVVGADKVTINNVFSKLLNIKDLANRYMKLKDEEQKKILDQTINNQKIINADNIAAVEKSGVSWLSSLFGSSQTKGGVKK
jgi:hypothetical protein